MVDGSHAGTPLEELWRWRNPASPLPNLQLESFLRHTRLRKVSLVLRREACFAQRSVDRLIGELVAVFRASHLSRSRIPKVAVLVGTSTGWGRRVIRAILNYANAYGPWDFYLEPRGVSEPQTLPAGWSGDGIIARISNNRMAKEIDAVGAHVINVSTITIDLPFQRVSSDTRGLAEVAISHLHDRGIREFGYVGLSRKSYSLERQSAFAAECALHDYPFSVFATDGRKPVGSAPRERLKQWLDSLGQGSGVLTWGITQAIEVITAAQELGIRVPDDVAVLAGDDDELLCEATRPSLSGINVPAEQMGREAARQLDALMSGEAKPQPDLETRYRPSGIVARASTDVLSIDDPDVAAAIRFIRSNPDRPLRVSDVADAVAVSRRSLERRFQLVLRHTMGDEIAAVHLQRAKSLLETTDMPIPKVAEASGYGSPEWMATVFKQAVGVTPLRYRARFQGR